MSERLTVVCLSDTHNQHHGLLVPDGDMLIHSGDATMGGKQHEIENFLRWMENRPHRFKVFVAGNHDFGFQLRPADCRKMLREIAPSVTYLQDSGAVLGGVSVYGAPWQPRFFDWAFNLDRGPELAAVWRKIPDETEILVTHGPAFGKLDACPDTRRVGCEELRKRIGELPNLKLHVFGHIHHSYGVSVDGRFVNAAICDEGYRPVNPPIVVEVETRASSAA